MSAVIPNPLVISAEQSVADAAALMDQARTLAAAAAISQHNQPDLQNSLLQKGRFSCVVVVETDQVVGVLTAADVVRCSVGPRPLSQVAVAEAMERSPRCVQETDLASTRAVLTVGQQVDYAPLPVLSPQGQLRGLLTTESLLWLAQQAPIGEPSGKQKALTHVTVSGKHRSAVNTIPAFPEPQLPCGVGLPSSDATGQPVASALLHDIISSIKACVISFRLFPDATCQHDFFSDGSEFIFGFSPAELFAQPDLWSSRLVELDFETAIKPAMQAVRQGQTRLDIEYRFRHGDGSIRWIGESCNARWDETQQCWMLTNVAIDITKRKQLEAHLRQSEAELRALFEAMDDLVMVLDRQGRYLKVVTNDSSKLCRPAPQIIGKTLAEVFPPEQANQFLAVVHHVLDTQAPAEFEYVLTAGGKERWFSAKCSAINTEQIVWVARDVSDRKQNELSLRQSEAKRRAILATMPDLMFRLGADGRYREVINPRPDLELFFHGRDPVGQRLADLVPADIANRKLTMKDQALATGELQLYEQQMQTDTGPRYEEVRVIKSDEDEVLFMIRDISDRKIAELELEATRNLLQQVINNLPVAVFAKDADTLRLTLWNDTCTKLMGYTPAEVMGKTDFDLFPAEQARTCVEYDRQAIEQRAVVEVPEETIQGGDGQPRIIHNRKLAVYDAQDRASLVIGIAEDITARKRAETTLRRQLAAIEAAVDGIGILQGDTYLYVNQSHGTLFGYDNATELVGKTWRELYSPSEIQRFERDIFPILARDRVWQGEATALRRDGSTFPEGLSLTLTEDDILICVCRDISEIKQAQAQIIHNALHDPLTGLPNRTLLEERLETAIQRAKRYRNYHFAVLFIDLDRFKVINDSLGHLVGDQLLIAIARRLQAHIRSVDLAARLGGDEFVLLLEDIEGADNVVQIVERILDDCQHPFVIQGHEVFTGMSIGIAMGNGHYDLASDVIQDADIAMYRAKQNRQSSYQFFGSAMRTAIVERHTLEMELHRAIELNELVVHYQPILDLRINQVIGFEALVRWHHPERGCLSPESFLTCAEETGLIVPIDRWVLAQAGHQLRQWQPMAVPHGPLKMHINLSTQHFNTSTLLQDIDQVMAEVGLDYPWLTIEITENVLIDNINNATKILNQLAERQIQASIDDFGIGYSSLQYLHRLPLKSLKIDRTFVHQIDTSDRDYQMVKTIAGLGRQLNLSVVAEGIENHHHLQLVQTVGCDYGQGFLFSRPLPADEIEATVLKMP